MLPDEDKAVLSFAMNDLTALSRQTLPTTRQLLETLCSDYVGNWNTRIYLERAAALAQAFEACLQVHFVRRAHDHVTRDPVGMVPAGC